MFLQRIHKEWPGCEEKNSLDVSGMKKYFTLPSWSGFPKLSYQQVTAKPCLLSLALSYLLEMSSSPHDLCGLRRSVGHLIRRCFPGWAGKMEVSLEHLRGLSKETGEDQECVSGLEGIGILRSKHSSG